MKIYGIVFIAISGDHRLLYFHLYSLSDCLPASLPRHTTKLQLVVVERNEPQVTTTTILRG